MNILENKRVTALSAVFLLAFGGLVYYGFSRGQDMDATKAEIASLNEKMEDFEAAKLPPTAANAKALADAVKQVEKASTSLQKQMSDYAAVCMGDGKNISSVELTKRVNAAIKEIMTKAPAKGCTVDPPAENLGLASYKNENAPGPDVPYLAFMLDVVKHVANIVIDSGATSLKKVYCAPLPQDKINSRKPLPYFPLSFEIAFTAKRSTVTDGKSPDSLSPLPRILNSITTDKKYLLIPTGLSIISEGQLTEKDKYRAPSPVPQGEDLGTEESHNKPQSNGGRIIATRKAGDPNELIRVHLNLQVYYFPSKGK